MGCTGEDPGICPTGTTGQGYTLPIELLGDEDEGCAVYTVSGGSLPPGLSINSDGARISGTPTQAGTFEFYLTGDVQPRRRPARSRIPRTTVSGSRSTRASRSSRSGRSRRPSGTVGTPYTLQMTANVADPKTWSINSGALPPGLAIDAATGLISGTPSAAGQFDFQVLATMNADTRSDTKALGIVVRDQVGVLGADPFTAARRATGEVSVPFDALLTATGGDGTYTWSLTSGELPPGLEHRGRRHLGDTHDRRRLSLHRDRHRRGRSCRQLPRAHRHR